MRHVPIQGLRDSGMILSTQSLDELRKSEILDIIIESCPTKIPLANPDMDRDLYRRQFNLNESEAELIPTSDQSDSCSLRRRNWPRLPISKWTGRVTGSTQTIPSTIGSGKSHLRPTASKRASRCWQQRMVVNRELSSLDEGLKKIGNNQPGAAIQMEAI